MPTPNRRTSSGWRCWSLALPIALPILLVALPLALPLEFSSGQSAGGNGQQAGRGKRGGAGGGEREDDEKLEGAGPAQIKFTGPTQPAAALVADDARERCEPVLVARPGGGAWLLCNEYEIGVGDRLAVRELGLDGKPLDPKAAPPTFIDAAPRAIVHPVAALDGKGRLVVVWTERIGGVAQLVGTRGDGKKFEPAVPLTTGPLPNRNADLARAPDGTLWLAWESCEWSAGIDPPPHFTAVCRQLKEEEFGVPERGTVTVQYTRLLDGDESGLTSRCIDPTIAASERAIAVAWSRWNGRSYQIAWSVLDRASGQWSPPRQLPFAAQADDLHPALAADRSGAFWLSWDRLTLPARGASAPSDLRIGEKPPAGGSSCTLRVAQLRGDEIRLPKSRGVGDEASEDGLVAGAPFVSFGGGRPRLAVTSDGCVHVVARFLQRQGPGGRANGFPLFTSVIDASGVHAPLALEGSAGMPDEATLCAQGDALLVAWQQDHRLEVESGTLSRPMSEATFQKMAAQGVLLNGSLAPSGIGIARLELRGEGVAAAATLVTKPVAAPPHYHPSAAALDQLELAPYITGADHYKVARGAEKYQVFWGDLHRHSSVSRCSRGLEPGVADRWSFGRDASLYDFMALTDHSAHVDALNWWRLDKQGELAASPGFVALSGFEWSTGFHGHQNVILRGGLSPFISSVLQAQRTPEGLYAALNPATALCIPHHPADVTRKTDFGECDPRFVRLIELYQAQRGSYEFDGCFKQSRQANVPGCFAQDALKAGLEVGFIASTDHGEGTSYACVLAESLDRAHLFDALRARRTYGATTKGMFVDFRVDDHLMGESFDRRADAAACKVSLAARGTKPIAQVVVFRDGAPWQVIGPPLRDPTRPAQAIVTLEIAAPIAGSGAKVADDWQLELSAPEGGVEFESAFDLPRFAQNDLGADRPEWTIAKDPAGGATTHGVGARATYLWKAAYAGPWAPLHTRLRVTGKRGAKLRLGSADPKVSPREVTLGELIAGTAAIAGDSPRGAWRLAASESLDAFLDPSRADLGVSELHQEWEDSGRLPGKSWYYARVIQADGEVAWSSPVFVTTR